MILIQRTSSYGHSTDYLDAVENESCPGCTRSRQTPGMLSDGCPIAERVLEYWDEDGAVYDYSDEDQVVVDEWEEVVPGRIHCTARTEILPGQLPLFGGDADELAAGSEAATPTMTVDIPGESASLDGSATRPIHRVTIGVICPRCGGRRGEAHDGIIYDGSLRMHVSVWENPCGHVDDYRDVLKEAGL